MKTTEVKCDTNHNFVHPGGMPRPVTDAGKQIFTGTQRALMKKSINESFCFPAEHHRQINNKCKMAVNRRIHLIFACLLFLFTLTPTFALTAFAQTPVYYYSDLEDECRLTGAGFVELQNDMAGAICN